MKASKLQQDIVVGIDVSKASLEVGVVPGGESWCTEQSPAEVNGLADRIAELEPALVVCEATGGLELAIVYALCDYTPERDSGPSPPPPAGRRLRVARQLLSPKGRGELPMPILPECGLACPSSHRDLFIY